MSSIEEILCTAAKGGDVGAVLSVLADHPGLNVNWAAPNLNQLTALHFASANGHAEVVKLLLAHPHISVNLRNNEGYTPFFLGCFNGHVSVVKLLLKDPRVDVTVTDLRGCTPLWHASRWGKRHVVEWLIASGRDLGDISNTKGKDYFGDAATRKAAPLRLRKWRG